MTWVLVLDPVWWKEWTDFGKLSFGFHLCTNSNTEKHKINMMYIKCSFSKMNCLQPPKWQALGGSFNICVSKRKISTCDILFLGNYQRYVWRSPACFGWWWLPDGDWENCPLALSCVILGLESVAVVDANSLKDSIPPHKHFLSCDTYFYLHFKLSLYTVETTFLMLYFT